MIKNLIIVISIFCYSSILFAQDNPVMNKWSYNTAYLMKTGKWESGFFQPFRYGINKNLEVYTHVLMLPLIPSGGVKIAIRKFRDVALSTEHSLSYPTPFLNIMSRKGIGGLISPEYDFSPILSIYNAILISSEITPSMLATAHAGFSFALRGQKPDPQSTIDFPLFYPRMAHYYEGTSIKLGVAVKGSIIDNLFYEGSVKSFIITRSGNNMFLENSGTIMWALGRSFRIKGGYVLAYGKYPYVTPKWQIFPTLDLVFGKR